jgi:hypothetical protein
LLTQQPGALFCTAMHRLNAFHKVCFLEEELNQEDCTLLLAVDVHRQCLGLALNRLNGAAFNSRFAHF